MNNHSFYFLPLFSSVMRIIPCFLAFLFFCHSIFAQNISQKIDTIQTDILIVGGGASGITAGLQAARLGVKVMIVEETPWLGGMLTSAGVGAIDGNNNLPSGLWGEFRQKLREYYGGAKNIETGWVSNTLFEPHIGDSIWKAMAVKEARNLTIQYGYYPVLANKSGKRIHSVRFSKSGVAPNTQDSSALEVVARVVIDATELGDVIALAELPFDVGMESRTKTKEECAPQKGNSIIQDLTWVAVLKDYRLQLGENADRRIPKPANYDPKEFDGCCKESCYSIPEDSAAKLVDAQKMLDYGRLPTLAFTRFGKGAKYMLNWPRKGNDYYFNPIGKSREERAKGYEAAKQVTMRFIYHLQTTLGFKYLGLPDDEFPSPDSLALIPYFREARRVEGISRMTINDVMKPYSSNVYRTAIAVGDYPVDHHHAKYPNQKELPSIDFPPVPSFSIPLGSLIPKDEGRNVKAEKKKEMKAPRNNDELAQDQTTNLIAAEKCISVSNIINGSTRLQPCVMLIGQAAGTLAALSVKDSLAPKNVSVQAVQQTLLDAGCWLLPFMDILPESRYFQPVQKFGLLGIIQGTGVPYKWANQTWFYPDYTMTQEEFYNALFAAIPNKKAVKFIPSRYVQKRAEITVPQALSYLRLVQKEVLNGSENKLWELFENNTQFLIRRDAVLLLDMAFSPFKQVKIDMLGNISYPQK